MGVFFVGFAGGAWVFVRILGWGAEGVVWANVLHMVLRVGFNLVYVRAWFGVRGVVSSCLGFFDFAVFECAVERAC